MDNIPSFHAVKVEIDSFSVKLLFKTCLMRLFLLFLHRFNAD